MSFSLHSISSTSEAMLTCHHVGFGNWTMLAPSTQGKQPAVSRTELYIPHTQPTPTCHTIGRDAFLPQSYVDLVVKVIVLDVKYVFCVFWDELETLTVYSVRALCSTYLPPTYHPAIAGSERARV